MIFEGLIARDTNAVGVCKYLDGQIANRPRKRA